MIEQEDRSLAPYEQVLIHTCPRKNCKKVHQRFGVYGFNKGSLLNDPLITKGKLPDGLGKREADCPDGKVLCRSETTLPFFFSDLIVRRLRIYNDNTAYL